MMPKQDSLTAVLMYSLRCLAKANEGGVAIIAAVTLPVLLGFGALAFDYSLVLLAKTKDQRTADLAAYGGALAYKQAPESQKETLAIDAALHIAEKNGTLISSDQVFINDGNYIEVTVSSSYSMRIARILQMNPHLNSTVVARVNLSSETPGSSCLHSLGEIEMNGWPSMDVGFGDCAITAGSNFIINGNNSNNSSICGAGGEFTNKKCANTYKISPVAMPFASLIDDACNEANTASLYELAKLVENGSGKSGSIYEFPAGGIFCIDSIGAPSGPGTAKKDKNKKDDNDKNKKDDNKINGDIFRTKDGSSNFIIFKDTVGELTIGGGGKLEINAADDGGYKGLAIYAPYTDLTIGGNSTLKAQELGCFGAVVKSLRKDGTGEITLSTDTCTIDNIVLVSEKVRLVK